MARKNMYLIIDTETCNSVEEPIPYDIGYAICDRQGKIYVKRAFVVAEVFCDMSDVMQSAYYADKIPSYWEDIRKGTKTLRTFWNIRKQILDDIKKYNVNIIGAYNMGFDKRAMNNLIRFVTKSKYRFFFPFGMKYICIWNMACQTILNTAKYIEFCEKNDLVSPSNNVYTSAEACYKYLTNNIHFEEVHKGLEDVEIEVEILQKCFNTHLKMDQNINSSCWRIPQKKRVVK